MTSRDLSELMAASETSVNARLHISTAYPSARSGCLVQCGLSAEDQAATGKRYHCLSLSDEEIQVAIRAMNKAARHSRLIRRLVEANSLTSPKLSRGGRDSKGQPWRAA